MRLIRILDEPWQVFRELGSAGWLGAFLGTIVFSMVANLVLVNAIGVDTILRRSQSGARGSHTDGLGPELVGVYAAKPLLMIAGTLVISIVMWLVVRAFHGQGVNEKNLDYIVVFAVCSYAACAREAVRLVLTTVVVSLAPLSQDAVNFWSGDQDQCC